MKKLSFNNSWVKNNEINSKNNSKRSGNLAKLNNLSNLLLFYLLEYKKNRIIQDIILKNV